MVDTCKNMTKMSRTCVTATSVRADADSPVAAVGHTRAVDGGFCENRLYVQWQHGRITSLVVNSSVCSSYVGASPPVVGRVHRMRG